MTYFGLRSPENDNKPRSLSVRYLASILSLVSWAALSLPLTPTSVCAAAPLQQRIDQLLADPGHQKTTFAVYVCDPQTDQPLYERNGDTALAPASNMKILTTAAVIDLLGADFTYKTTFALINDNLTIFASGDPLTGDPVLSEEQNSDIFAIFHRLLGSLKQRNMMLIGGDLIIDDFIFDDVRFHPSWPLEQANRWYAAQVSGLNFNDNCVDISLTPADKAGQPACFTLTPSTSYVTVVNQATTAASGPNTCWAARPVDSNHITLRGAVRRTDTINVSIERPSAYFGHCLAEYLLAHDVRIAGKLIIKQLRDDQGRLPAHLDLLVTHETPLKDVLTRANTDSLNLAAECLFKTLGAYHDLPPGARHARGSWTSGAKAVGAFLDKLGLDPNQFTIDDGSGLSHQNRVSPRALATVLAYMHHHNAAQLFRDSLASPDEGTLQRRGRFAKPQFRDRLMAKTGYIRGAWALSGYCQNSRNQWLVFAILAHNKTGVNPTSLIDKIVKEIIKS